jgi:threonine dehydratase
MLLAGPTGVVPALEEFERVARGLDPVFANSPPLRHAALDDDTGAQVGAEGRDAQSDPVVQGRGAVTWMRESGPGIRGVVCASAGNFGQGRAYAARAAGSRGMSSSAEPRTWNVGAMRRLGARVELGGEEYDAAIESTRAFAADAGLRSVQDGREVWIAAGAATIGLELTHAGVAPDIALVPVGNSEPRVIVVLGVGCAHPAPGEESIYVTAERLLRRLWNEKR